MSAFFSSELERQIDGSWVLEIKLRQKVKSGSDAYCVVEAIKKKFYFAIDDELDRGFGKENK